jgi:arylsulfatase
MPGRKAENIPRHLGATDIGRRNLSCYTHGLMGYQHAQHRPHRQGRHAVHRLLRRAELHRRPLVVHHRAERAAHRPQQGRHPGVADRHDDKIVTIAALLKEQGYATGQFGKNHLGDLNHMLPTNHGFDEFYGNLYHLNAEEEPEMESYPTTTTSRTSANASARAA